MRGSLWFALPSLCAAALLAGCHDEEALRPTPSLTGDALMDPASCQPCHADHVEQWAGSMHAYAGEDPLFLAMNRRAQRETKGAIGSFCVKCHAPVAVRTGATTDGLNLAELPAHLRGVTCYFCHSVAEVQGTHDAPLALASDGVLRGSIRDPVPNTAHPSAYSALHDREDAKSASLCGSCHDIVTPNGTHLERTYAEWQGTLFAEGGALGLTCGQCHMNGRPGVAADAPNVGPRRVHDHNFPGVDLALGDFPGALAQRAAVQASLDDTLQAALCVKGGAGAVSLQVVLDNVGAGHGFPSGATQDRRAWVEVVAYEKGKAVYESGVVGDDGSVTALADPDLWLLRDCLLGAGGEPVHMFWDAVGYDSNQLPGPVTATQSDPRYYLTHVMRTFPRPSSTPSVIAAAPDRVTMRVQLVPVGLDVLDDLIQSGDLDPAVRAKMPTLTLAGTDLEWTAASATIKYVDQGQPVLCVTKGLTTGANASTPAPEHTKCAP
jgi:hypothetical protein